MADLDVLITSDDGEELVDELLRDGLLAASVEDWRAQYLELFSTWFQFCREANRAAMALFVEHWRKGEGGSSAALLPTAGRIFGRAISNFTGAVVLCERGAAIEAATLARSILEASFWLAYLAKAPDRALSDLEADDLGNWIDREKELQRTLPLDSPEIENSKLRVLGYRQKLGRRKKPVIADVARNNGSLSGYLRYRILSGHFGHLSHSSLRHHFRRRESGGGVNILGPHPNEIPSALYFSASALSESGVAYASIVCDESSRKKMEELAAALEKIVAAEQRVPS